MKSYLSHTFLNAVLRLVDAPQQTLSKATAQLGNALRSSPPASSTPDHIMRRLESVFEALSELSFQPDIAAAGDLVCRTLQAELPTAAVAAGLYNINCDEMRIVAATGLEHDLLRGAVMSRGRCLAGRAVEAAFVVRGDADGADWIGTGEQDSTVLLCPVLQDGHLLGVLALAEPLCAAEFIQHDLDLVGYVASQLAGFIQTHRLRPSLPAPAITNPR